MFLAFLLRSLSFPAHEFLRGLLFVYGVQLHQLMPNSILHLPILLMKSRSVKRGAKGAIAFAYSHGEEVDWEKVSSSRGRPLSVLLRWRRFSLLL
jgi:hypothetical protein